MIANPKVHCKSSDLFDMMKDYLGENMNLARIKFCNPDDIGHVQGSDSESLQAGNSF